MHAPRRIIYHFYSLTIKKKPFDISRKAFLLLFHTHQYCSDRPAEEILSAEGIIELTSHQRHPVILFGLEDGICVFRGDQFTLAHFVGVGLAPRVDLNLVAVPKTFKLGENTGAVKRIPDMAGCRAKSRPIRCRIAPRQ